MLSDTSRAHPTAIECTRRRGKMSRRVHVVVASKSKPKLDAARESFAKVLGDSAHVSVEGVEVESGVAAQPVGYQQTREGARNRLAAARLTEAGKAVLSAMHWATLSVSRSCAASSVVTHTSAKAAAPHIHCHRACSQ
eukprot:3390124-Amphidinium_carterae.1